MSEDTRLETFSAGPVYFAGFVSHSRGWGLSGRFSFYSPLGSTRKVILLRLDFGEQQGVLGASSVGTVLWKATNLEYHDVRPGTTGTRSSILGASKTSGGASPFSQTPKSTAICDPMLGCLSPLQRRWRSRRTREYVFDRRSQASTRNEPETSHDEQEALQSHYDGAQE